MISLVLTFWITGAGIYPGPWSTIHGHYATVVDCEAAFTKLAAQEPTYFVLGHQCYRDGVWR